MWNRRMCRWNAVLTLFMRSVLNDGERVKMGMPISALRAENPLPLLNGWDRFERLRSPWRDRL